jgi:DNA modification methylase
MAEESPHTASADRQLLKDLAVEFRSIESLTTNKHNARTHSREQIGKIAESIKAFGFVSPILIDANGKIIAGHGRLEAAKRLGLTKAPVAVLDWMTDAQRRAYAIADNRLAELAGWDRGLLKIELSELSLACPELDLTITGFVTPEIDQIILEGTPSAPETDARIDNVPAVSGAIVSRPGDLWQLGPHRLLCGDARAPESYQKLLGKNRAALILADPPYNVRIDGHARGLGQQRHDNFVMAAGEMSAAEFTQFLTAAFTQMAAFSVPGSLHYTFMDWRHLGEVLSAGNVVYDGLLNICVWAKNNGGMGSLYRSAHELVLVWQAGGRAHANNIQLGKYGRNRTNVWTYPGANSFGPERAELLALHPTVKPVALLADIILDASNRSDLVLDPFAGSGSTIIAAHKVGRSAAAIELDPKYVDVTIRRFERVTGEQARDVGSALTFAEMAEWRADEIPAQSQTAGAAV